MIGVYDSDRHFRNLSLLYLAMGKGTDGVLSLSERDAVSERLGVLHPNRTSEEIHATVEEILQEFADDRQPTVRIMEAIRAVRHGLGRQQRSAALRDLLAIARADGIIMENEQILLRTLAVSWEIPEELEAAQREPPPPPASPQVLQALAYIYLTLAHGTDEELSVEERQVMLSRLMEWQPEHSENEVRILLDGALQAYASGDAEERYEEAVLTVKHGMPTDRRAAALQDLIKIANADGLFLDREEDLINRLLSAWDVPPDANYRAPSRRSGAEK